MLGQVEEQETDTDHIHILRIEEDLENLEFLQDWAMVFNTIQSGRKPRDLDPQILPKRKKQRYISKYVSWAGQNYIF